MKYLPAVVVVVAAVVASVDGSETKCLRMYQMFLYCFLNVLKFSSNIGFISAK